MALAHIGLDLVVGHRRRRRSRTGSVGGPTRIARRKVTREPGRTLLLAAGAALVAAALVIGCEETDLTGPSNGVLVTQASPSQLAIDPRTAVSADEQAIQAALGTEERLAFTDITAQVLNDQNVAVENVNVVFESEKKAIFLTLANQPLSSTPTVRTDGQGFARVRAVYTESCCSEGQFEVTARSGILSDDATLDLVLGDPNQLPLAAITLAPPKPPVNPNEGAAKVGEPVILSGEPTVDPDDDPITCYKWTLLSSNPDPGRSNPEIFEQRLQEFSRIFQNPQEISVRLEVTDDPAATAICGSQPVMTYSPLSASVAGYQIVEVLCSENSAPTATIAGPETVVVSGAPGQFVQGGVNLDGRLSQDQDTGLAAFAWSCGSEFAPTDTAVNPDLPFSQVRCDYKVEGVIKTYTVTLAVKDKGTGLIDPTTGTFPCQKVSEQDTVMVQVSPLQ